MNHNADEFKRLIQVLVDNRRDFMNSAKNAAMEFIDDNFQKQGFQGSSLEPWKPRSFSKGKKKALLIDRGHLRRGFSKTTVTNSRVTILNTRPYAAIHNDGGELPITPKMRRFFWAMYLKKTTRNKKGKLKTTPEGDYWKALALTKKTAFTIPQRKMIDDSPVLDRMVFKNMILQLAKLL